MIFTSITGCATPDRTTGDYIQPGTTDLLVEHLQFRGVESVSERQLRAGLATREDPGWRARRPWHWLPIVGAEPRYFNYFNWRQDRERILAFYRQQGYYHASVESESIIEDPEAGTVRVLVTVDEGPPTRVDGIDIHGLTEGVTPPADELLTGLPLADGDIFVQSAYRQARSTLRQRLRNAGFAYAEVDGRVFVDPETHTADVFFFANPGPLSRFGPVYILGLDEIDERAVRRAIPLRQGEPYDPRELSRARDEIFDLGVFGMVTVLPAHEAREGQLDTPDQRERLDDILDDHDLPGDDTAADSTASRVAADDDAVSQMLADAQQRAESRARLDPDVPLIVRVQEATGYNLRVGTGVAVETTRQDIRGLVNWSARNFLGGLRRLEHINAIGYAWAPTAWAPPERANRGVILSSELRFQQPQFIESRTNLRLRGRVERDVREGFSVWNPSARIGLDRPLFEHFLARVSYNTAYFSYFNVQQALLDPTATELGVDFQTQFLLEFLEQSLAYDRRNDLLDPTRGYLVDLTVQQAGSFVVGGEFDYIKPILSAEGYIPFDSPTRSVLALRSRLGTVYDIGRDTGVPVQSRLHSGGPDGMRSFGRRRLSLYTATGEPVSVGGLTQFEASVEPRFRLLTNLLDIGDVWGAVFVDSATVLGGQLGAGTGANVHGTVGADDIASSLLYGTGLGTWWKTPVGPIRLDFAYTISNIAEDPRFRRCEDPTDYGTEDCQFRFPPEEDPIQNLLLGWGVYLSIGHSF